MKPARTALLYFLLAAGIVPLAAGQDAAPTVEAGKGWRYRVYAENLPAVDNLAIAPDGSVYATQELPAGNGKLVRVHNGRNETIASDLNRPDGLLAARGQLYVTEEVAEGRVLEVNPRGGARRVLAVLHNPEGIGLLPDGGLVISEDSVSGRLVRLREDGMAETLTGGLNRPEGLAVGGDGTIFFAETGTGRVLAYKDGELNVLLDDLDEPDQVKLAPDGALWVTEDARPGRLLRLKNGALEVVLSGLMAPQGIAFAGNGAVLVAEQGRGRILAVSGSAP